jgi:hypothetical protein
MSCPARDGCSLGVAIDFGNAIVEVKKMPHRCGFVFAGEAGAQLLAQRVEATFASPVFD